MRYLALFAALALAGCGGGTGRLSGGTAGGAATGAVIGIVGGRFVVDVTGNGVDITEAERAFSAVDAAKLESAAAALPK